MSTSGGGGVTGAAVLRELLFVEQPTAQSYTRHLALPAGSHVIGWQVTQVGPPWAADQALLDFNDTIGAPFSYIGAADLSQLPTYSPTDGSNRLNSDEWTQSPGSFPVVGVDLLAQQLQVDGDQTRYYIDALQFNVSGSTGNDGTYTCASASTFAAGKTTITTVEPLIDPTADGSLGLSSSFIYAYERGNAFYWWAGYGNGVPYPDGDTITATVTTTIATPPVVPTGITAIRFAVVYPFAPITT